MGFGQSAARMLRRLLLWLIPYVLPVMLILVLVIVPTAAIFGEVTAGDFDADGNRAGNADQRLKQAYQEAVQKVTPPSKDRFGRENQFNVPWGLPYAIDMYGYATGRNPGWKIHAEEIARKLAPRFEYKESVVIISTKNGSQTIQVWLLTKVDSFFGITEYHYRWQTRTVGEVTITEEVVDRVDFKEDWTRFDEVVWQYAGIKRPTNHDRIYILETGYGATLERENSDWLFRPDVDPMTLVQNPGYSPDAYRYGAIPSHLLPIFIDAAEKYGIKWYILAAIAYRESGFNPNAVGPWVTVGGKMTRALGMMQFLPDTFEYYGTDVNGNGKSPFDPEDAIYAAARMIAENGGRVGDYHRALYRYNRADWYVRDVLAIAENYRAIYGEDGRGQGLLAWPTERGYPITSFFGLRTLSGEEEMHYGIDIATPVGTPLYAIADGVVVAAGPARGYGNWIVIQHLDFVSIYGHLYADGILVSVGQRVSKGQLIGKSGNAGRSTGPHLHFGIALGSFPQAIQQKRYVNPLLYVQP